MAGSLSTETKQYTQEVEDDGQENDAWNTQATIPSETRQVLCFTEQWEAYTQVLNFTKNWQLTQSLKGQLTYTSSLLYRRNTSLALQLRLYITKLT